MNNNPLVTIGIPVYNEGKFIRKTISSALNQTYTNIEIIISDNCSSDSTYDIILENFITDDRLKLIRQKDNLGPVKNFEFVLKEAKGEYFMWLGGHDTIHPDFIKTSLDIHFKNPKSSLVYFNRLMLDENYNNISSIKLPSINSGSLSQASRALKVYKSLNDCTHIHGVWRLNLREKIVFADTIGPDHLILFILAINGTMHEIPLNYYFRVNNRDKENSDEANNRYLSYGFKIEKNDVLYTILKTHLDYLLKNKYFTLFTRLGFSEKKNFFKYLIGKIFM